MRLGYCALSFAQSRWLFLFLAEFILNLTHFAALLVRRAFLLHSLRFLVARGTFEHLGRSLALRFRILLECSFHDSGRFPQLVAAVSFIESELHLLS